VPIDTQLTNIDPNPNIPQLVCLKNLEQFCIINTNTYRVVKQGQGSFYWRAFDEYLLVEESSIKLYSVGEGESRQSFESSVKWQ
jgi:hypothetical protein